MNKSIIFTIIYIIGIIVGALFLDIWGSEVSLIKNVAVFIWTIIFLITLFYTDKNEKK
ncbi:hypothetical protein VP91_00012910 [Candidatus Pelagibacter ubique]|uniref:Transmembrane protein n=1 Tax=Pelagibacter ubique TaxID=198252 RepID=A0ABX1T231_PELUQ|nr:hypothetical protein [Candidatus Pelagibacter ubique]NMN68126.1 hypothetical protein [Candidatus Pelagibacter ubique]